MNLKEVFHSRSSLKLAHGFDERSTLDVSNSATQLTQILAHDNGHPSRSSLLQRCTHQVPVQSHPPEPSPHAQSSPEWRPSGEVQSEQSCPGSHRDARAR